MTNTGHKFISHNISTGKFVVQVRNKDLNHAADTLEDALVVRNVYLNKHSMQVPD